MVDESFAFGLDRNSTIDVFKDENFDIENELHFGTLVIKNTLMEYGLTCVPEIAIAVDDFTNQTVLFVLGNPQASLDILNSALTKFLASTTDNTPLFIMDLAYLCQEIAERVVDKVDFKTELLRVLAEHNLYGMPPVYNDEH